MHVKICESDSLKRMALDLETLRTEIDAYLASCGLPVFYASHRSVDPLNQVYWDVESRPDFREFVAVAKQAGAKVIDMHHHALSVDQIDAALDELEDSDFTREEKRHYETRLRKLREYEGFTCSVELAFSVESRVYTFEVHTEWFESLTEILAELEAVSEQNEEEDDGIGSYFSNN